jgi:hypothetical protein
MTGDRVASVALIAICLSCSDPTHAAARILDDPRKESDGGESAPAPRALEGYLPIAAARFVDVNGDADGYADTNETIDLFLTVHNPSRSPDLTNVVVEVSSLDPRIDCVAPSSVTIGSVPSGTDVETPVAFRLHVHPDADRAGPSVVCIAPGPSGICSNFVRVEGGCSSDADCHRTADQNYSGVLSVKIRSEEFPVSPRDPQSVAIDLDLDVVNPVAPTSTFVEGFEAGLLNFLHVNLDEDRASNAASDGYRCQYNDPDFVNSNSYGSTECYLGFGAGQSPVNDWHPHSQSDGGRAFLGIRSLHYGKHLPSSSTTSLSQLAAVRTRAPIRLAARVCRDDAAADKRSCDEAIDCLPVGGGPCVAATPELTFKHQISAFRRTTGTAIDRGVVQVQSTTDGVWEKLYPSTNIHDEQPHCCFSDCSFDPVDDGNDEDDYFDPSDPDRRLGPSSTCLPEFSFSYLGDTDDAFDADNIGRASDGPGLAGSVPPGTWVESRFDLSRYRGRSVRLRFLYTTLQPNADTQTWSDFFAHGLEIGPEDDGWYVDDIRVTQTLGSLTPTGATDATDNDALPGNLDRDARGDDCDCAPSDPGALAIPTEIGAVQMADDKTTLSWSSAASGAGAGTVHDLLRGALDELPVGGGASETCVASGTPDAVATDPELPVMGSGFWYLVRGRNSCGAGTWGARSDGTQRSSTACP